MRVLPKSRRAGFPYVIPNSLSSAKAVETTRLFSTEELLAETSFLSFALGSSCHLKKKQKSPIYFSTGVVHFTTLSIIEDPLLRLLLRAILPGRPSGPNTDFTYPDLTPCDWSCLHLSYLSASHTSTCVPCSVAFSVMLLLTESHAATKEPTVYPCAYLVCNTSERVESSKPLLIPIRLAAASTDQSALKRISQCLPQHQHLFLCLRSLAKSL